MDNNVTGITFFVCEVSHGVSGMVDHQLLLAQRTLACQGQCVEKAEKSGAVILGQSVWFLPVNEDHEVFLQKVSDEIIQSNGASYVMRMIPQDDSTSQRIVDAFNQARNEDTAILEQCDSLLRELEKESGCGKFTFAELEGK